MPLFPLFHSNFPFIHQVSFALIKRFLLKHRLCQWIFKWSFCAFVCFCFKELPLDMSKESVALFSTFSSFFLLLAVTHSWPFSKTLMIWLHSSTNTRPMFKRSDMFCTKMTLDLRRERICLIESKTVSMTFWLPLHGSWKMRMKNSWKCLETSPSVLGIQHWRIWELDRCIGQLTTLAITWRILT